MKVAVHHHLGLRLVIPAQGGKSLVEQGLLLSLQRQSQVMTQQPLGEDAVLAGHEGLIKGFDLQRQGRDGRQQLLDGRAIPVANRVGVQAAEQGDIAQIGDAQEALGRLEGIDLGSRDPRLL